MLTKVIFIPILFIFLVFIFTILDIGMEVNQLTLFIQPIIFALSAVIAIFFISLRKATLIISLSLLSLMVFTYLLNLLEISNWIGSLGFGMFIIVTVSYLPNLIREGFIHKY